MPRLKSPSSPRDAIPLTSKEEMAAWDAGYEMASYVHSKGRPLDADDIFIKVIQNDRRVPRNLTEDHPSFWEWREEIVAAANAFAESVGDRVRMAASGWMNYNTIGPRKFLTALIGVMESQLPATWKVLMGTNPDFAGLKKKWGGKGTTVDERGIKGKKIMFRGKVMFIGTVGGKEMAIAESDFKHGKFAADRVAEQYIEALYSSTYVMTGRTFQNKDLIRSIFGPAVVWDGALKRWLGYGGGSGMDRDIWTLRRSGVKVEVVPGRRLKPGEPIPDKMAHSVADAWLQKNSSRYNWHDVEKMGPEKAMEALEDLTIEAGRKAKQYLDHYRMESYEAERTAKALEKAWDKWDWDALARFNVVSKDEADFAAEVIASFGNDVSAYKTHSRWASLKAAGRADFAGIDVRSVQDRTASWWDDMEKLLREWWSFHKSEVKRSRGKLLFIVRFPNAGPGHRPSWEIEVRGPITKPTVYVGGASKTFGPDANLLEDIMYWIDSITRP